MQEKEKREHHSHDDQKCDTERNIYIILYIFFKLFKRWVIKWEREGAKWSYSRIMMIIRECIRVLWPYTLWYQKEGGNKGEEHDQKERERMKMRILSQCMWFTPRNSRCSSRVEYRESAPHIDRTSGRTNPILVSISFLQLILNLYQVWWDSPVSGPKIQRIS